MLKPILALIAITAILSTGVVGKIGFQKSPTLLQPAPMLIHSNGAITFPGRAPQPETVYQLRRAIQTENAEMLQTLLVKHRFFVAPSS